MMAELQREGKVLWIAFPFRGRTDASRTGQSRRSHSCSRHTRSTARVEPEILPFSGGGLGVIAYSSKDSGSER